MLKMGLEKEYFYVGPEGPDIVPKYTIPYDDSGWLVEARGEPFTDPYQAVYSLIAQEEKIKSMIPEGYSMTDVPVMELPKSIRIKAGRVFSKGLIRYKNLYGYEDHRLSIKEASAGVHISFTSPRSIFIENKSVEYNGNFDWVALFRALDLAFKEEIKTAKRNPGFYELKSDGRVEYRSLPANVDLKKVITVLSSITKGL